MGNRFYYGMPSTQAFQAMNTLDDDVQAQSAAAATAAQTAVSSAAQAANARDAALAAWQASTAPNEQLAALGKQVHSGAIVDTFLYDASKDSDGGAWRKRCKHTSWENETLTPGRWLGQYLLTTDAIAAGGQVGDYFQATGGGSVFYQIQSVSPAGVVPVYRGNTREFPAQALIVAEATRVVIYDATQSTLPMWMVFQASSPAQLLYGPTNIGGIAAMNGILSVGDKGATGGLYTVSFVADNAQRRSASSYFIFKGALASRNATPDYALVSAGGIASVTVNDVAMIALPDAPIDPATGLPTPTIAVATASGVSVIKQDGTVVISGSSAPIDNVEITSRGNISLTYYGHSAQTMPIPQLAAGFETGASGAGQYDPMVVNGVPFSSGYRYVQNPLGSMVRVAGNATAGPGGLVRLKRGNTAEKTMVAAITNACNSGWQVGDARGAWLADTAVETLTGKNLVSNADFSTGDVDAYGPVNNCVLSVVSGHLRATKTGTNYYGEFYLPSNLFVTGKTYSLSIDYTGGNYDHKVGIFQADSGGGRYVVPMSNGVRTITTSFVANGSIIGVVFAGVTDTTYAEFDNFVIRLVDPDRSVKNSGLVVNGGITKTAVAPGAQLVSYAGFSVSNYLEQPYNSSLDLGTGDFCVMGWMTAGTGFILERGHNPTVGGDFSLYVDANSGHLRFIYQNVVDVDSGIVLQSGARYMLGYMRSAGKGYFIVNGQLFGNDTGATSNLTSPGATLRIGGNISATSPCGGSLALWRFSATAPSADQIAQIYRDELALFQPGAQCTIDGTSSSVTAIAYDDAADILHVGTSWGRSAFHGLQRVESAATSVGTVTALSAAQGAHMTGGAGGARYQQPAILLRDDLRRNDARRAGTRDAVPFDFDSVAGMTDFTLTSGWSVRDVLVGGIRKRLGATKDYTVSFDGYRDTVRFAVSPGAAWVQVMAVRSSPG